MSTSVYKNVPMWIHFANNNRGQYLHKCEVLVMCTDCNMKITQSPYKEKSSVHYTQAVHTFTVTHEQVQIIHIYLHGLL